MLRTKISALVPNGKLYWREIVLSTPQGRHNESLPISRAHFDDETFFPLPAHIANTAPT